MRSERAGGPRIRWPTCVGRYKSCAPKQVALLVAALLALLATKSQAAEVIPPKPDRYFNDYADVVSKTAALRFNEELAQFERETSDQVVVAIFPKMQSDSDIADYTQRVAQAWGVGQKERRNGVVLFVFVQDRKMFIQVGYGLEGALPDITAFDITEYKMKPRFRNGDYEGGLATGIDRFSRQFAASTRDRETLLQNEHRRGGGAPSFLFFIIFLIALIVISRIMRRLGGYGYSSRRGGPYFFPGAVAAAVGHLAAEAADSAGSAAEAGVLAAEARDRVGDRCERETFSAGLSMHEL